MKARLVMVIASLSILFGLNGALAAQEKPLAITANVPVVDGTVAPGEYSFSKDFGQLTYYANRSADALWLGIVGKTTGWVAVGLGSLQMDGATIFMGFVDGNGKTQFKPQAGVAGHSHQDTGTGVSDTITAYSIKETSGVTTLEVRLKAASYIKPGQDGLRTIFAIGPSDSFSPHHLYRSFMTIGLS